MTDLLSAEQRAEFEALFASYDLDGDGRLCVDELHAAMHARGDAVSREDAAALLAALDDDDNGSIDLGEFLEGMAIYTARSSRF